ncbi:DUF883 domain-containing protein [Pseudomonas sp. DY-1]|uniref:DUF883 family protein n=1 Tax=unclassified Pseudomonas TaxID=196821 RepID=UPI000EA92A84|nr:DUF883 family protein [Pseudomonas sp. DY-1]AYF90014.1 DUF883 domain-containing protein [Pseudomonas sp. DY-1]
MPTKSNGLRSNSNSSSQEFHSFLADVEDLMKDTTSLSAEELTQAQAMLSERISAARASMEQLGDKLAQQSRKSAAATNDYVHEQPWKVIGASAAAAFLFGFVLARRS